jgi:aminodeoxyfutalosine deaminase
MFGTTLEEEYAVAARLLGLDEAGVADLARAAVTASFLPPGGQSALLAEIDDYTANHHTTRDRAERSGASQSRDRRGA